MSLENSYPYPELLPLLRSDASPEQYLKVIAPYRTSHGSLRAFNIGDEYWDLLAIHTFSRCPFCMQPYQQQADTYSLWGWSGFNAWMQLAYFKRQNSPEDPRSVLCKHFFGAQKFLNLHENLPHECTYQSVESGEVPYLTNWFFHDDLDTRVVLHALPICRIEADTFVPRYTVFSLTYFCDDEIELRKRHFEWQAEFGKGDREFYPAGFAFPSEKPSANPSYDLAAWAQRGQLGHMDHTQPAAPLRIGVGTTLPAIFQNISGRRSGYQWRDGIFKRPGL